MMKEIIIPKKRISSIDALRGFALLGILMFHCMEGFDLFIIRELNSPFWQTIDSVVFESMAFLFAGKAYAIFSLLFGLSFFMQMDSQADKGYDFRWRFLWRLTLLLILGYLNSIIYMGEFFVVYAILGITLIPVYKVSTKWLIPLIILLFLQIPDIYTFISALNGGAEAAPPLVLYMDGLYEEAGDVFMYGSFSDVLKFNLWKGLLAKLLWVINNARFPQLIGLFIAGMLIGRAEIHKDEEKIVKYSKKALPYGIAVFALFYAIVLLLPNMGVEGFALKAGTTLFKTYSNLGMMLMYVSGFMLLYYKTNSDKILDKIAPVGRMSVTNYMVQGFIGVPLFYGFGLSLAVELTFLQSFFVGIIIYAAQVVFSNWWIKRYYYGPIEWLWRVATWLKPVPFKRSKDSHH